MIGLIGQISGASGERRIDRRMESRVRVLQELAPLMGKNKVDMVAPAEVVC